MTSILIAGSYGGMTGDMQMIDEYTILWIKRLVVMPIMMDMSRCGRNVDEKNSHHIINRDDSDNMKRMKKDIDESVVCKCFTLTTCLDHCSFMSYLHPVYIEGLMKGIHHLLSLIDDMIL